MGITIRTISSSAMYIANPPNRHHMTAQSFGYCSLLIFPALSFLMMLEIRNKAADVRALAHRLGLVNLLVALLGIVRAPHTHTHCTHTKHTH